MISTTSYFTLYDNVTIRRAKIIITYKGYSSWEGVILGSITPCNPTNDVTLYNSFDDAHIVASADGNLYAKHTNSQYTHVEINITNYTSYWTY